MERKLFVTMKTLLNQIDFTFFNYYRKTYETIRFEIQESKQLL